MAKTIDQLQAEIEKKEAQLSQERHKEQRRVYRLDVKGSDKALISATVARTSGFSSLKRP